VGGQNGSKKSVDDFLAETLAPLLLLAKVPVRCIGRKTIIQKLHETLAPLYTID
jgi:hypothetical protein